MDKYEYMEIALKEAKRSVDNGGLPIGAVLLIDGEVIGKGGNNQVRRNDYDFHAESLLIIRFATDIKLVYNGDEKIELYSTLEPCFKCFAQAVHNRVSRIVYGCIDHIAGVSSMNLPNSWYAKRWSEVVEDERTGYVLFESGVDAEDVNHLVEKIDLVGNINSIECRERVKNNFSVKRMVEGYERVYEKILS